MNEAAHHNIQNKTPSCPHCGSAEVKYKKNAAQWECQNSDCEKRFDGPASGASPRRLNDRAARPKSIFFSYGHDANRELVERFENDLKKRGHQVWIDFKEIGAWDDWRGSITRGIHDSELAIAFVSKHSIRDPGVCLNEIAIAMNRFGSVYPVLLEEGIKENVPVTIQRLQWEDLSRWKDIRDGKVPDTDWDRWYEEKLINLIEKLEGEATRFADDSRVLREVLQPSSFESKIVQHVPGFIGRDWVFDAYQQWLDHQKESRLFWIKAGPGVGKSAIAANLAHRQRGTVAASWFCDAKSPELKDPNRALRSIAFQLALRWEDYRVILLTQLQLGPNASNKECDKVRKNLDTKNTQELFSALLAEPMVGMIWRDHKWVVAIDALDEATDEQGNNRITELISQELSRLPSWLGFVVTSRPEAEIVNRLGGFKPFAIDAEDPRNIDDLRSWYEIHLGHRPEIAAYSDVDQQRIQNLLIERSGGMILYLKMVEEGFKEGSLTPKSLEALETGISGLWRRYFDSFQHRFGSDYDGSVRALLRLLLAAGGPLPEDLACEVLGWDSEQFLSCRDRIGSYVVESNEGYELFHKTLGEWLIAKTSGKFHLDNAAGRQALADVLFNEINFGERGKLRWRKPISDWLPEWLPVLSQKKEPGSLCNLGSVLKHWANSRVFTINREDSALVEAESLYHKALNILTDALPENHPALLEIRRDLVVLLHNQGRHKEADSILDPATLVIHKF